MESLLPTVDYIMNFMAVQIVVFSCCYVFPNVTRMVRVEQVKIYICDDFFVVRNRPLVRFCSISRLHHASDNLVKSATCSIDIGRGETGLCVGADLGVN